MIERVFEQPQPWTSADLPLVAAGLATLTSVAHDCAELIDQIAGLEALKSAVAAAEAEATAAFAAQQRAKQQAAGVPASSIGKGIAAQIGLARRESPHAGSRHLGLAEALVHELPFTLAALRAGLTSEWRATLIARETACLTVEHRQQVDAELAGRAGGLGVLGDRATAAEAKRISYRLDPYAVTRRASQAAGDRHVSLRPAPDAMTWLGALLPAREGVAAYAALRRDAGTARAAGDQRSRGQVMADTLVQRITGQATADAVPVEIHLVMTDQTLLHGDNEPAELPGIGPIPAPLARNWLRGDPAPSLRDATAPVTRGDIRSTTEGDSVMPQEQAKMWLRRLYTHPTTGQLVAMDSKRRCFDGQLRQFVITADRTCRTPWCDAPIRHVDHALRAADDGDTNVDNANGLCEACNYAKEAPGWRTRAGCNRGLEVRTPTGHRYPSRPPPPVGQRVQQASPTTLSSA